MSVLLLLWLLLKGWKRAILVLVLRCMVVSDVLTQGRFSMLLARSRVNVRARRRANHGQELALKLNGTNAIASLLLAHAANLNHLTERHVLVLHGCGRLVQ